jgi:hypothetical protein
MLRSAKGELVGCLLCVPQRFHYQGKIMMVMGSSSFYVDETHRGKGGLIFLKYSQLNDRWPLFGNSANADAARLWKARGASPIGFSDHELLGIVNCAPVIEEAIARKTVPGVHSRLAGQLLAPFAGLFKQLRTNVCPSGELVPVASADEAAALLANEPSAKLTSVRDLPYIKWRYFSVSDRSTAVFAYRSKQLSQAVFVSVNERTRGYRGQIRGLNLLDIYPEVPHSLCLEIVASLVQRYGNRIDVVVLRCQDVDRQKVLRDAGFVRREFEAPNAWLLDRCSLASTCAWYLVPADGDWLI